MTLTRPITFQGPKIDYEKFIECVEYTRYWQGKIYLYDFEKNVYFSYELYFVCWLSFSAVQKKS